MIDQASELRKAMKTKESLESNMLSKKKAKVISISSGKGGVGKTSFAINFSIALKRLGYEVIVIDADIGLSNIEIVSGINLNKNFSDIVFSNMDIYDIIGNGPEGIKVISGGSGLQDIRILENENLPRLINEIEKLQNMADFIIIDTGAGISSVVTSFIMSSNEVIIVSTPDPTSLMDSYVLIKTIISLGFNGEIKVVANLVNNRDEGREVFNKLYNATNNFLKTQIRYLGYVERNNIVSGSIRNQIPFVISHENSSITKKINIMAMNFLENNSYIEEIYKTSFARKLIDMFSKRGD